VKVAVPAVIEPPEALGRVHLVGIGGAGLSGIARLMLARGLTVSGSDGADSPTLAALRDLGARVVLGHHRDNLAELGSDDTLVVSTAVREDNPEYVEALARGLRVWPRSAALASVMSGHRVVAVAGTHGKTTTTSLLATALKAAGADPTYAIGGDLTATGVNAALGGGEVFVAEADESDGAFLVYPAFAGIVTNVEADHLDHWRTTEAYATAFEEFADGLHPDGFLVCCVDDPGAARLAERQRAAGRTVITVGIRESADVDPTALAGVTLWAPGDHYLLDALAAFAAGRALGWDAEALCDGLASYTGTVRRMQPRGEAAGVRVYDSYAHHPTEIAGDLASARALAGTGRVIVAFQPHLVSRTREFGVAMGRALSAADAVVVTDVYLAREDADPEVDGGLVARAVNLPSPQVDYVPGVRDVAAALCARAEAGDLVLTLGAGDITTVVDEVLAGLSRKGAPREG
jgi:UDP-N-acetylmuramate--alanine ligase